jgi:SAM-dependent methyltransferase
MTHYTNSFYNFQKSGSYISAQQVFPVLFRYVKPRSAIDIGCGVGPWLKALESDFGITDVQGVDGDYAIPDLLIAKSKFVAYDLKSEYKAPRKFDLAISVEVGEHLPDSSADNLVGSLTGAADMVLFSAALPGQTGTYHINEQFPEYWAKKFKAKGFVPIDFIRKEIWNNEQVEWWYRQNILLFVKENVVASLPEELQGKLQQTDPEFLTRIHPGCVNYLHSELSKRSSVSDFIKYKLYPLKKKLGGK